MSKLFEIKVLGTDCKGNEQVIITRTDDYALVQEIINLMQKSSGVTVDLGAAKRKGGGDG